MAQVFTEDKTYQGVDFKENPLPKGEYEKCSFINCDFSGTDLGGVKFLDCKFADCNLSLAKSAKTVFQNAQFRGCKMLGFRFDACNPFGLSFRFEQCTLNHSSFYGLIIKGTLFSHCQLQETDFTQCDLTGAAFDHCDLVRAVFEQTVLEKADFRTARNYALDPERNRIRKAKFSLSEVVGLLGKYGIQIDEAHG